MSAFVCMTKAKYGNLLGMYCIFQTLEFTNVIKCPCHHQMWAIRLFYLYQFYTIHALYFEFLKVRASKLQIYKTPPKPPHPALFILQDMVPFLDDENLNYHSNLYTILFYCLFTVLNII